MLSVRRLSTGTDWETGTGKSRCLRSGSRKPKSAVYWVVSLHDCLFVPRSQELTSCCHFHLLYWDEHVELPEGILLFSEGHTLQDEKNVTLTHIFLIRISSQNDTCT